MVGSWEEKFHFRGPESTEKMEIKKTNRCIMLVDVIVQVGRHEGIFVRNRKMKEDSRLSAAVVFIADHL